MNIFASDPCPIKSAEFLDNKRVIKMILESAQLLSTAMYLRGQWGVGMYKPTHIHHPCTKWAADDWRNYGWVYRHLEALASTYTQRYGKVHKSTALLPLLAPPHSVGEPSVFVNCCRNKALGIDYTNESNVHLAYQLYLNDRWDNDKQEPTWEVVV